MKDKTQSRSQVIHLIEDMRAKPWCAVRRPTNQTIADTTDTAIDLTASATIEKDTHSMFSTANADCLTVVVPGVYLIEGYVYWTIDADGFRSLWLEVDSSVVAHTRTAVTGAAYYQTVSVTIELAKAQVIELWVSHSAGADLDLIAGNGAPRLSALWVRP